MSEAPTSKPKNKGGRPKGSKDTRPRKRSKRSPHYGLREGDKKYDKLNPARTPTEVEMGVLVAEFNHCQDIQRVAKSMNLDPENALHWLEAAAEKDPRVLDDKRPLFVFGVACRSLAVQLLEDFQAVQDDVYGLQAAKAADYLMNRGMKYIKDWKKKLKEAPEFQGAAAVDAEMEALDDEIDRLSRAAGAGKAASAQAQEAGAGADGGMGQDANGRDGQAERPDIRG